MDIDNQTGYWDSVAQSKTFTHPLNPDLLSKYISPSDRIVDFGCGYGRLVKLLLDENYQNVEGYDTSKELIIRGQKNGIPGLYHFDGIEKFPIEDNSVNCFLLFAVLTCIPSNQAQKKLISILYSKLKPNGIIYISDYYIQEDANKAKRYEYLNDDPDNYGTFTLLEGATFRHHTREWIADLLQDFNVKEHSIIDVKTMNGNSAKAFQVIVQKNVSATIIITSAHKG
jgi:SAM-dependent methyltransferase